MIYMHREIQKNFDCKCAHLHVPSNHQKSYPKIKIVLKNGVLKDRVDPFDKQHIRTSNGHMTVHTLNGFICVRTKDIVAFQYEDPDE